MPAWVWLLLAVLVLAAVAIPLLIRSRRHRAWQADLADAEREVNWYAHDLLPTLLRAGTAEGARGAWDVGRDRVVAVEQRLTALAESARNDADRDRAVALHDAVQQSRDRTSRAAAGDSPDLPREIGLVVADLDSALRPPPSL